MFAKYDQEFIKSKEGNSLYSRWRNIRNKRCKEWDDFSKFAEWALNNGYKIDLLLKRYDSREDYSPENCYFHETTNQYILDADWKKRWDKAVNRIREYYGMEPVGGNNG